MASRKKLKRRAKKAKNKAERVRKREARGGSRFGVFLKGAGKLISKGVGILSGGASAGILSSTGDSKGKGFLGSVFNKKDGSGASRFGTVAKHLNQSTIDSLMATSGVGSGKAPVTNPPKNADANKTAGLLVKGGLIFGLIKMLK